MSTDKEARGIVYPPGVWKLVYGRWGFYTAEPAGTPTDVFCTCNCAYGDLHAARCAVTRADPKGVRHRCTMPAAEPAGNPPDVLNWHLIAAREIINTRTGDANHGELARTIARCDPVNNPVLPAAEPAGRIDSSGRSPQKGTHEKRTRRI